MATGIRPRVLSEASWSWNTHFRHPSEEWSTRQSIVCNADGRRATYTMLLKPGVVIGGFPFYIRSALCMFDELESLLNHPLAFGLVHTQGERAPGVPANPERSGMALFHAPQSVWDCSPPEVYGNDFALPRKTGKFKVIIKTFGDVGFTWTPCQREDVMTSLEDLQGTPDPSWAAWRCKRCFGVYKRHMPDPIPKCSLAIGACELRLMYQSMVHFQGAD